MCRYHSRAINALSFISGCLILGLCALAAPIEAPSTTVLYSVLTPDGQFRIEISDRDEPGIFETYRMRPWQPPGSGTSLSGISIADWDVWSVTISADSQIVTSRKGCLTCLNGHSQWRYVVASIDGQLIEWAVPDIFADGFENNSTVRWQ